MDEAQRQRNRERESGAAGRRPGVPDKQWPSTLRPQGTGGTGPRGAWVGGRGQDRQADRWVGSQAPGEKTDSLAHGKGRWGEARVSSRQSGAGGQARPGPHGDQRGALPTGGSNLVLHTRGTERIITKPFPASTILNPFLPRCKDQGSLLRDRTRTPGAAGLGRSGAGSGDSSPVGSRR